VVTLGSGQLERLSFWPASTRKQGEVIVIKKPQKSLKKWTKQEWGTKSGKPSAKTGERYLPKAAIAGLTKAEYAATTAAKRAGTKAGKQVVKQPKKIANKTAKFRK